MAKRKNAGFKGIKQVTICNGATRGKIPEEVVNACRVNLNNLPKDYEYAKREITRIRFTYESSNGGGWKTIGNWKKETGELYVRFRDRYGSPQTFASNTVHEIAHAWYTRVERLDFEKINAWNKVADGEPFNEYVRRNKNTWSVHNYRTEQHSTVAEYVETGFPVNPIVCSEERKEELVRAYLELHGRT